jgi:methylaspartate mutase sigma subunit
MGVFYHQNAPFQLKIDIISSYKCTYMPLPLDYESLRLPETSIFKWSGYIYQVLKYMKVVTGVVGNDIHVVANRLIDLSLQARGYEVFNLGVNTYLEEFFDAVIETGAEVLLISSLNGEAEGWGREVPRLKAKYKKLDDVIMMIGGNLVVGSGNAEDIVPRYKGYGFDIVCHQVDLNTGIDSLEEMIKERSL